MCETNHSVPSTLLSLIAFSLAWSMLSATGLSAAQKTSGVGSVSITVGAAATSRTVEQNQPTGSKLGDATIALVDLLDNDLNRCVDATPDCRVYLVAETAADPEIAYRATQ